jgi:glycosyltransferase involved in cell wall biosynthesis
VGGCGWRGSLLVNVAVIIAAYQAAPFIGECIASWRVATLPHRVRIDIRIGVDGCEETARALDALGVSYGWSPVNVGPYVIRNTLIESAPADAFAIFDADDRVLPRYLRDLVPILGKGIAAGGRYTIDEAGDRIDRHVKAHVNGVSMISETAWRRVGPFLPWRIAADAEWHRRAKRLGVRKRTVRSAVYERRRWPGALTQREETGFGSAARAMAKAAIRDLHRGPMAVPDMDRVTQRLVIAGAPLPEPNKMQVVTTPMEWRL